MATGDGRAVELGRAKGFLQAGARDRRLDAVVDSMTTGDGRVAMRLSANGRTATVSIFVGEMVTLGIDTGHGAGRVGDDMLNVEFQGFLDELLDAAKAYLAGDFSIERRRWPRSSRVKVYVGESSVCLDRMLFDSVRRALSGSSR